MIDIVDLVKQFPGTARPAVDRLTLSIPDGEVCVLIGPSGCGKTTTMRIINRMIEADAGIVRVGGRDIMQVDTVTLRRSIGYVIQHVGLFPHWTIAENVATVPRLLGWTEARTEARTDELLVMVGMDPSTYRDRFPRELSGGQKQRVGFARALAADPPLMLMDEPFGAIDPITRGRLQDEFLKILRALRKTIVFVTHDIDEAIKMGDRIAILKDGALLQYDTPERVLAEPANSFVSAFVGADRALKRLSPIACATVAVPFAGVAPAQSIDGTASLRDALALMLETGEDVLAVRSGDQWTGVVTLAAIRARSVSHRPHESAPPISAP
jgi:osmoprotectant transport system ATP-binding protein